MTEFFFDRLFYLLFLPFLFLAVFIIHEAGHYLIARLFGVRVEAFTVGAGRVVKSFTVGADKTPVRLKLWPIAGHVSLKGDDLRSLKPAKRLAVILAGPIANLITPFFLFLPFLLVFGLPVQPPVIAGLMVGGPAEQAGLMLGDELIEVNGQKIERFSDLMPFSWDLPLEPFTLTVERNGETYSTTLTATERSYIDRSGITRHHGQIGIQSPHVVYAIKDIHAINGEDVEDNPKRARDLLTELAGQTVTIDLYMTDEKTYPYRVHIHKESNPKLNDPDHRERKLFYLHPLRNAHYLPLGVFESVKTAASMTSEKIADIATLPFQLFPLDRELLTYDAILRDDVTPIRNWVFLILFKLMILSVVIGLINLLPLPRLDGSMVLYELWEIGKGEPPTNRQRALLVSGAFLIFYLTVATANFANMPVYFEKKIKNATEWVEDIGQDRP